MGNWSNGYLSLANKHYQIRFHSECDADCVKSLSANLVHIRSNDCAGWANEWEQMDMRRQSVALAQTYHIALG